MDTREDFLATTADGDQIGTGWLVDAESGDEDIRPGSTARINPDKLEAARLLAGPDGIGVLFQQLAAGQVLEIREVTREVFQMGGGDLDAFPLPDGPPYSNLSSRPDNYPIPSDLTLKNGHPVADKIIYLWPDDKA